MAQFIVDDEEVREKQFQRLLRSGSKTYIVKEHAENVVKYGRNKGHILTMENMNFTYDLYRVTVIR